MAIKTKTDNGAYGAALTISEMDKNFMSTWEIITGAEFASTDAYASYNTGPLIETDYEYAARFNVMAFEIVGHSTSTVLWYPNWVARNNPPSTPFSGSQNNLVDQGNSQVTSQGWSFFGTWNSNIGIPMMYNSSNYAALSSYQVSIRAESYHTRAAPSYYQMTYRGANIGYQEVQGAQRYSNVAAGKKCGVRLRFGTNSTNVYFRGSIYLLGLRVGAGYLDGTTTNNTWNI